MFPRQSAVQFPQNDLWQRQEAYSVQVKSLMTARNASVQQPSATIEYALLLSDASNYFWERNIFEDAVRCSDAAEAVCQGFLGQEFSARADVHTIAGAVRDSFGISERAKTLHQYEMAVALRQRYLDETEDDSISSDDMWNYANAWGNMTPILLDLECYEDVILYADLAMKIKRKLLGSGSAGTIACYEQHRNKHIALAALGRVDEALAFEADPMDCMSDPSYSVVMVRFHFFWANIALVCGKLEAASERLLMVLEWRKKFFGPSGRSTLDTYYMLSALEECRGQYESAE